MNLPPQGSSIGGTGDTPISRRSVLAAGGVVFFAGLSGCLNRVASGVTNTTATPAGVFMRGSADGFRAGTPHVARLTPTLALGVGGVSNEVELEGWVTAVAISAANYNNSRSNRSGIRAEDGDADADDDGVGDGTGGAQANYNNTRSNRSGVRPPDILDDELDEDDETFQAVARMDDRLKQATVAAWDSISNRSARTGRAPELDTEVTGALEEMEAALGDLRTILERCSDESCVAALENVADREADLAQAKAYAANGQWEAFGLRGGGDDAPESDWKNDILVGDYLVPPMSFDGSGSYSPGGRAALYRYLDSEPIVSERFAMCLPDAAVPGGNGSIKQEVTPERVIEYLTGHGGGVDHGWGGNINAAAVGGGDDCDDTDEGTRPAVCGTTPHFVAEVSGPTASGRLLAVVRAGEGSVVVTVPSDQDGSDASVCASSGDDPCGPGVWARQTEAGASTGVLVYRVRVQPPACPEPFPALLYVQRCENDGQLIYTGGWIIDDASLYGNALTVVSMRGATSIVGIDVGDVDGDRLTDLTATFEDVAGGNPRFDGYPYAGPVEQSVAEGVLSRELVEGDDSIVRKRPGRTRVSDSTTEIEGDEYGFVTNIDAAAPVLHLVNADGASNEVKFKAGAALSGQVN